MWKGTAPTLKAMATRMRSIARTEIFAFADARARAASLPRGRRAEALGDAGEVGVAGDDVEQRGAHEEERGGEGAEEEVLEGGLGGAGVAAAEAGHRVDAERHGLEAQEEHEHVVGAGEQHRAGGRERDEGVVLAAVDLVLGEVAAGEERREAKVPVMMRNSPTKPLVPGQPDGAHGDEHEHRRVPGHHLREAAELRHVAGVAPVVDDADEEEERAGGDAVVDHLEDGARDAASVRRDARPSITKPRWLTDEYAMSFLKSYCATREAP
jgi:hypothetical protein